MDERDTLEVLGQSDLFGNLPEKELRKVLDSGKIVAFSAGQDLATTGEAAGRYYLILDGEAEVEINGILRATVGRGAGVGEVALVDGGERMATVKAITPLRTFSLASWNFQPLLERPAIAHAVIALLARRLRAAEAPRPA